MRTRLALFVAVFVAFVGVARPVLAVPSVRTMYNAALEKERAVRAAMSAPDATSATLREVHATVVAYQSVVRHYPASGYCDDALWQAGRLLLEAYAKFGDTNDRDAGVHMLKLLASEYPTSKFARQVPAQLASIPATPQPLAAASAPPIAPAAPAPVPPAATPVKSGTARPSAPGKLATIKDVRRTVFPDAVRVVIELDAEVTFHDERIADPDRVFVDLPSTRAVVALVDKTLRFDGDADLVRQVRIGRHPNSTTRVVLDTDGVASYSVYPLYDPFRLVIDCVRSRRALAATTSSTSPGSPASPGHPALPASPALAPKDNSPAPIAARRIVPGSARYSPQAVPRTALLRDANAPLAAKAAPPAPAPAASAAIETPAAKPLIAPVAHSEASAPPAAPMTGAPPPPNLAGGFSIARQLGLGVSRIVIDAGHGGHDPGAKGKGVTEAELVLDIALRLRALLEKIPGVEVILTRSTDEFIPLPERTALANREGADLFLSIHANASSIAQARGIETYFLNFANSMGAAAVAARENAASGQAMNALPDFVKAIALNNKLDESRDFATAVQHSMVDRLRGQNRTLKDLGVKQAPFVVLIGAAMPSVLAEISFVTNPQEAKLLKSNAYRQKIAEALLAAIRKYQTSLRTVATVAHQ